MCNQCTLRCWYRERVENVWLLYKSWQCQLYILIKPGKSGNPFFQSIYYNLSITLLLYVDRQKIAKRYVQSYATYILKLLFQSGIRLGTNQLMTFSWFRTICMKHGIYYSESPLPGRIAHWAIDSLSEMTQLVQASFPYSGEKWQIAIYIIN